jgi:hypothetical protein
LLGKLGELGELGDLGDRKPKTEFFFLSFQDGNNYPEKIIKKFILFYFF